MTAEPIWIDERDALTLHDRLLALHGGAAGVRDAGLLLSALARPQQHFADAEDASTVQLAGLYTAGIVRNHPFIDGNRRTGFVPGDGFVGVLAGPSACERSRAEINLAFSCKSPGAAGTVATCFGVNPCH